MKPLEYFQLAMFLLMCLAIGLSIRGGDKHAIRDWDLYTANVSTLHNLSIQSSRKKISRDTRLIQQDGKTEDSYNASLCGFR